MNGRERARTLELDVAVDEADLVHPPDGGTQLAEDATDEGFGEVAVVEFEEVKELAARRVVEREDGVGRGRERR